MTQSIRTTIATAIGEAGINGDDEVYAGSMIDTIAAALREREYTLVENVIDTAQESYGYGAQAADILSSLGFEQRPLPVTIEEPAAPATIEDRVARLESGIGAISESLATLTALAKRHLGADV